MNERVELGSSARTVQYLWAVLRRALGQALKWGPVARNIATLVDAPRHKRPEAKAMSAEEAGRSL